MYHRGRNNSHIYEGGWYVNDLAMDCFLQVSSLQILFTSISTSVSIYYMFHFYQAALNEWLDSSQPKKSEEGPLFKIFWRRIILDEGHNIKNHKTSTSIAICSLQGGKYLLHLWLYVTFKEVSTSLRCWKSPVQDLFIILFIQNWSQKL